MKRPSHNYFYTLRRARREKRSQGLAEFALILPIYLMMMFAVFDFGWYIGDKTQITMMVATAVQVGARSEDSMVEAMVSVMEIATEATRPRIDLWSPAMSGAGAVCATFVIRPVAGSSNMRVNGASSTNGGVGTIGLRFGGDIGIKNKSRLVVAAGTSNWLDPKRVIPGIDPLDLVDNKVYLNVEAWYKGKSVTLDWAIPDGIYDSYLQFSLQSPE